MRFSEGVRSTILSAFWSPGPSKFNDTSTFFGVKLYVIVAPDFVSVFGCISYAFLIVFLDLLCLLRCLYVLQNVLRSTCFTYFSVHPDFVGKCILEPVPLKFGFIFSLKTYIYF